MLLAIDVGNTNVKIGLLDSDEWKGKWAIRTVRNMTADEYGVSFQSLLSHANVRLSEIEHVIMSSVVPPVTGSLRQMFHSLSRAEPVVVAPGVKTGIRIRTDHPTEVGSDLVIGAVAAYDRYKTNCIVVGFGTALTFSAIGDPGDLLGVAIAPGLKYAAEALFERTAQLRLVDLEVPKTAIGKNTVHAIQSGILFGYVGMVEGIINRFRAEMPGPPEIIATGGQAEVLAPLTDYFTEIDPWLNLEGLRLVSELNR
jgi:type III pantothenate kinase